MKKPLILVVTLLLGSVISIHADRLKIEDLFANAQFANPQLSPDGKTLAVLAPSEGVMNIAVIDIESKASNFLTREKSDIGNFFWANNERIVYMPGFDVKDNKGRFAGGIFAVNKDGKKFKTLRKSAGDMGGRGGRMGGASGRFEILNIFSKDDKYILVIDGSSKATYPDVSMLNVYTGRKKIFYKNPGTFRGFFIDREGEVRGGYKVDLEAPDGEGAYYFLDPETDKWTQIRKTSFTSGTFLPADYDSEKDELLVVTDTGRDTGALYRMNWRTGELIEPPIYEDSRYDLINWFSFDGINSPRTGNLVGLFYQRDKPTTVYIQEDYKVLQKAIDSALPDLFNRIVSTDREMKIAVIRSYSDVQFPRYYLLYIDNMKMEFLADSRPGLRAAKLQPTQPIAFTARDGLPVEGYLTLPATYSKGNPVPLFVYPHGGPWARDTWGQEHQYTAEVQYWASRGYAVLQVNFRGSTGYGKEHLSKSFKKIDDMHNDLIDGVKWTIDQGYADPDRIGVGGASWGGYETMVCITRNPELFTFGINFMGIVDLPMHINRYKSVAWDSEYSYNGWLQRIGDPDVPEERKMLESYSAINYIDEIKIPLFIYHGVRDRNVHIEQARVLMSALKKRDIPFTSIIRAQELHSVSDEKDRFDTYHQIDEFLSKHGLLYNE